MVSDGSRFVTEDLGAAGGNVSSIALADLNRSMGRALAAIYWYGA